MQGVFRTLSSTRFGCSCKALRRRSLAVARHAHTVLGIETSCDDTGIAIVNSNGEVLGNVLESQQKFHARYGGIIPPRAQDLHRACITNVLERCLSEAATRGVTAPKDLDAIAVTTRPGLPLSLAVGLRFAKHLARKWHLPLLPIHHMEAHALQARMEHPSIPLPFLCLLISGGHCQLVFVRGIGDFQLLGETMDDAPGEAFDKIARRLRLWLLPRYRLWNGGRAVEDAAREATQPEAFEFPLPLSRVRNCNFSFAGIKNNSFRAIRSAEWEEGTPPDMPLTQYANFCAGLQRAFIRHLMNRTQRALEFCIERDFFGLSPRTLVVSGGVANNDAIFAALAHLAEQFECVAYRPSKRYCSDNGVMIAWNGIEHLRASGSSTSARSCLRWDYENVSVEGKAALGVSIAEEVENAQIKCKWIQQPLNK